MRLSKIIPLITVLAGHGLLLWSLVQQWVQMPVVVIPPTIQGVVIMAQPQAIPKVVMQPPIVKPVVPTVTPKTPTIVPIKNVPSSEKAITQADVPPPTFAKGEAIPQPVAEPILPVIPAPTPIPETVEEVTPPRSDAKQLNNLDPTYPAISKRLGEQGRVLLYVYILANGTVGEARLKQSSGFSRLDQAALEAVKKWHYQPARRGQQTIDFWYVQPLFFNLN